MTPYAHTGAALADQVKNLDSAARKAKHKGNASAVEMARVRAKLIALIGKVKGVARER